ncbi:MAG: AAA family ATPase [Firmicutes bacterium]|nr:AAA family ATPase [Bacillota bacterium]
MEKTAGEPAGKIRLKEITLENAACFDKITIPFGENITVLTGTNGTGKTTVLNAIVGMFTLGIRIPFVPGKDTQIYQDEHLKEIINKQSRLFPLSRIDDSTIIKLEINICDKNFINKVDLRKRKYLTEQPVGDILVDFRYPEVLLPIGTNRIIVDKPILGPLSLKGNEQGRELEQGMELIRLIGSSLGFSIMDFKQWLVNQDYLDLQAKQKGSRNKALDYFRENLAKIMPPEQSITLKEIVDMEPVFSTRTGDVPIGALSSGFQSVLSIYWNILYNLLNLYPQSENPFLENAVAVIDEVDAHLHPEWQQIIVHSLRTLFPNVQFIMATHSPLVVSGCGKNEAVFLKYDDENKCVVIDKDAPENPKGWLVESLLTGPFNLKTARGADVNATELVKFT